MKNENFFYRTNPPTDLDKANYGTVIVIDSDTTTPKHFIQSSHDDTKMEWVPLSVILEANWAYNNSILSPDLVNEHIDLALNEYMKNKK